jgi:hypothetical protein
MTTPGAVRAGDDQPREGDRARCGRSAQARDLAAVLFTANINAQDFTDDRARCEPSTPFVAGGADAAAWPSQPAPRVVEQWAGSEPLVDASMNALFR